ncbi:MAG: FHA domain-containing protein, partial [Comamonadaceae bacterium]
SRPAAAPADGHHGSIKVLSGAAAGREVPLVKVVTTIGKPGVAVAAITKRSHGFVVAHVEGSAKPMLNGAPIGPEPMMLKDGDMLELAGTQMQFLQVD